MNRITGRCLDSELVPRHRAGDRKPDVSMNLVGKSASPADDWR